MRPVVTPETTSIRTTINIDDELLREAQEITGEEPTALTNEGIRTLIARESARRLARFEGSDPNLDDIPRRRPGSA